MRTPQKTVALSPQQVDNGDSLQVDDGNKIQVFCPKCNAEISQTVKRISQTVTRIQEDQIKCIIARVYHYFEQENEELKKSFDGLELTALSKFRQRTALATGVSETTVAQILQEEARRIQREETRRNERLARKRARQTDSSSEEDSDYSAVHEEEMVVVKEELAEEPLETNFEEPEIYVEMTEVKTEPEVSETNDALADPISVDFRIERRDEEATSSNKTVVVQSAPKSHEARKTKRSAVTPPSASAPPAPVTTNAPPAPPRGHLHALPVQATPGGSLDVRGDCELGDQTPGARLARQARQPSLDLSLCSDVVERVEEFDMSEDEAAEMLESDQWQLMRDGELPGASGKQGASNTVFLAPLAPNARSEVTVAAEVDVRPSTSTVTALSQAAPKCDGSDLDSDFDDEFDAPAMPVVGRDLPATEELDEPLQGLVNEIDTGMDDAADSLLGTSASFTWSPDFDSFWGFRGQFSGPTPGPIKDYETPYDAFTDIWDQDIMRLIATETNRYAQQTIETMRNAGTLKPSSRLQSWSDTNADEIMVFFAMLMYMAIDPRTSVTEYWTSDEVLQLPGFKSIMSFNRYTLLNKFLHFVDNGAVESQQLSQSGVSSSAGLSRRLGKLAPIIEHLGKKFEALYNLGPDICIDESLTLFKGRLAQTIRSKAARFGIKSYELCESRTGYMAKFQIYPGKDDSSDGDLSLGVNMGAKSTKMVLELLQGLEHRGHCVMMDNYYNCPSLARYLKSLGFDCLGTLRANRRNVPSDIKASEKVKKGTIISRHAGDVSIIAWMDSKMVNIISTYHRPDTYFGTTAGKQVVKPVCVRDYNKSMGGVDLKDQKLSMYLLERKRGVKWYMKLFKRLLNVSINNALVMYQSSLKRTTDKLPVTHREFRYALADSLLKRHRSCSIEISPAPVEIVRLRRNIMHEPEHLMGRENTKRCVMCQRQKKSKAVHSRCITCDAYLCYGDCWRIWHSATKLPGVDIRGRKRKRKE